MRYSLVASAIFAASISEQSSCFFISSALTYLPTVFTFSVTVLFHEPFGPANTRSLGIGAPLNHPYPFREQRKTTSELPERRVFL